MMAMCSMFEANFRLIFYADKNEHDFTGTMNRGFSLNSNIQFFFIFKFQMHRSFKSSTSATSIELHFAFETVNFLLRFFSDCQTRNLYLIF